MLTRKKFISALCAFAMLGVSSVAFIRSFSETKEALKIAVKATEETQTMTDIFDNPNADLLYKIKGPQDYVSGGLELTIQGHVIIDLNGNRFDISGRVRVLSGAYLEVRDSTREQKGRIKVDTNYYPVANPNEVVTDGLVIESGAQFALNGGKIDKMRLNGKEGILPKFKVYCGSIDFLKVANQVDNNNRYGFILSYNPQSQTSEYAYSKPVDWLRELTKPFGHDNILNQRWFDTTNSSVSINNQLVPLGGDYTQIEHLTTPKQYSCFYTDYYMTNTHVRFNACDIFFEQYEQNWIKYNQGAEYYKKTDDGYKFFIHSSEISEVTFPFIKSKDSDNFYDSVAVYASIPNIVVYKPASILANPSIDYELSENGQSITLKRPDNLNLIYDNIYGKITDVRWYCSIADGTPELIDESAYSAGGVTAKYNNILFGAQKYTFFARYKVESGLLSKYLDSNKATIYSRPVSPTVDSLQLNGKVVFNEGLVTLEKGAYARLSGNYKRAPGNVADNIVKEEVQWERKKNGGEFTLVSKELSYVAPTNDAAEYTYRFGVRTQGKGGSYSDWVYKTININVKDASTPIVVNESETEQSVVNGDAAELKVNVSNANEFDLKYKWYVMDNSTGLWESLTDKENYHQSSWFNADYASINGATTNKLTIAYHGTNSLRLKCKAYDNGSDSISGYSEVYYLTIVDLPLPTITVQPISRNFASAPAAKQAVTCFGKSLRGNPTYLWESSDNGVDNWTPMNNETSTELWFSLAYSGTTYYRCKVSNEAGSVYSEVAKIVIAPTPDGILKAEITTPLTAVQDQSDTSEVVINNEARTITCHINSVIAMTFEAEYDDYYYNQTEETKYVSTAAHKDSGLNTSTGIDGKIYYYVDTSQVGTFTYYGYYQANFKNGEQVITFDQSNSPELVYKVSILPNEAPEVQDIQLKAGESTVVSLPSFDEMIGYDAHNHSLNGKYWLGNHLANDFDQGYHYIRAYELFVEVPTEEGGFVAKSISRTGEFFEDEAGTLNFNNFENLVMDTTCPELQGVAGSLNAYIVCYYMPLVDENDGGIVQVKHASAQSKSFTITIEPACAHEHIVSSYTFGNDEEYGPYIMFEDRCMECNEWVDGGYIWVYSNALPLVSSTYDCTKDGMLEHKEFHRGDIEKYYVFNEETNKWEETTKEALLVPAHHNYQHVDAIAPTCTTDGTIEHYHCDGCNKDFIKDENDNYAEVENITIPAYHAWSDEWMCDDEYHWHTCSNCDELKDKELHSYVWVVDKPSTKEETGLKHRECIVCGHKTDLDTITEKISYEVIVSEDGNTVTFDIHSDVSDGINLTQDFMQYLGKTIIIKFGDDNSVTLNPHATNSLVGQNIVFSFYEMNNTLEGARLTFNASIADGNVQYLEGSKITIKYKFDLGKIKTKDELKAYFVNGEEKEEVTLNYENGYVVIETSHLSIFAVTITTPQEPVKPSKGGLPAGAVVGIVIGSILIVAIGGFAFFWFVIKKKTFADLGNIFKKKK